MEQGKIMEAEVPTVRMGATPTGIMAPPPRNLIIFGSIAAEKISSQMTYSFILHVISSLGMNITE